MESLFNRLLVTLTELPLCSLRTLSPFNLLCLLLHAGGQTGRWSWVAQSNTRFPSLIALSGFFSGHSRHFLIVLTLSVDGGLHLLFADTLIHLVTASSVKGGFTRTWRSPTYDNRSWTTRWRYYDHNLNISFIYSSFHWYKNYNCKHYIGVTIL